MANVNFKVKNGLQVGTGVTITSAGIITATSVSAGGSITAASFYGDGSNLVNAGSSLSASSGSQRLVLTSLTSGTMTSAATNSNLTYNSSTNTLSCSNVTTTLINYGETVNVVGNTGTAATINLANGNFVTATLTGNCTFTFTTGLSSGAISFTLVLTNDGTAGRSIVWPAAVKWPNGTTPVRTSDANKTDVYTFFTYDNGTTWWGNLSLYNYS